jgi:uncharacterized membrane protein YbhN (UPF0104 family)
MLSCGLDTQRKVISQRYSTVLILIAVAAAAMFVYSARVELIAAVSSASFLFAALTVFATLALNLVVWFVFHASVGNKNSRAQTARMFFGGQVAKYLPGKVWGIVYQATVKSSDVPVGNIIQANIVTYALTVLSTVFACVALLVYPNSLAIAAVVIITGAILSAYLFSSDHLYRVIQQISRLSRRFELTSNVPIIDFSISFRFAVYGLLVCFYVLSNLFLLFIFFEFSLEHALQLTAYLGIAWLAGIVVAITPSGLGVREVVFIALGSVTGTGSYELYASIAIVARAVQVLQDLFFALIVPPAIEFLENKYKARAQKTK